MGSGDGVSLAVEYCGKLGVLVGISDGLEGLVGLGIEEGYEVSAGEKVCKGCGLLRTIEALKFAIKPALSVTW